MSEMLTEQKRCKCGHFTWLRHRDGLDGPCPEDGCSCQRFEPIFEPIEGAKRDAPGEAERQRDEAQRRYEALVSEIDALLRRKGGVTLAAAIDDILQRAKEQT